jgi:antirestriction protein ArdC
MKTKEKTTTDIYSIVTDRIISQLESGVKPWVKSWKNDPDAGTSYDLPKKHNGEQYKGINVISLWMSGMEYPNTIWMTYNQAKELGGQVKKGEKGSPVFYAANCYKKEENTETGEVDKKVIEDKVYMKLYWVFNVAQIECLPEKYYLVEKQAKPDVDVDIITKKAIVKHGGDRAFYSPSNDYIQIPKEDQFINHEAYISTLSHELTHWTGHETRLNRTYGKKYGDDSLWEGSLFTFDDRLAIDFSPKAKVIGECDSCNAPTKQFYNCRTATCHELVLLCDDCAKVTDNKTCIHDQGRKYDPEFIG